MLIPKNGEGDIELEQRVCTAKILKSLVIRADLVHQPLYASRISDRYL